MLAQMQIKAGPTQNSYNPSSTHLHLVHGICDSAEPTLYPKQE